MRAIRSGREQFQSRETRQPHRREPVKRFTAIERAALRKLRQRDAAVRLGAKIDYNLSS